MFEKYTEKARRVIFFSRYEASTIGGSAIESEHILLGLLREDLELFRQLIPESADLPTEVSAIRSAAEAAHPREEKVSTSVDLPLSSSAKRILSYAAEASGSMGHHHIGTEHLLVGLLKDESSLASRILRERGLRLGPVETQISAGSISPQRDKAGAPNATFPSQHNAGEVMSTRERIVEESARRNSLAELRAMIHSLVDLLLSKGVINEDDRREIMGRGKGEDTGRGV